MTFVVVVSPKLSHKVVVFVVVSVIVFVNVFVVVVLVYLVIALVLVVSVDSLIKIGLVIADILLLLFSFLLFL